MSDFCGPIDPVLAARLADAVHARNDWVYQRRQLNDASDWIRREFPAKMERAALAGSRSVDYDAEIFARYGEMEKGLARKVKKLFKSELGKGYRVRLYRPQGFPAVTRITVSF